jgi:hypothetical protein
MGPRLRLLVFIGFALGAAGLAAPSAAAQGLAQTQQTAQARPAPARPAQTRFDGTWSVLVVTEQGTCDRAYRYSLRIVQGVVYYDGEAGITMNGGVDAGGRVTVSLSRGQQSAQGSGQLSGDNGTGTWIGRSPTTVCSGYWEAERRG